MTLLNAGLFTYTIQQVAGILAYRQVKFSLVDKDNA